MTAEERVGQTTPCPASRDWAYIGANSVLWLLGAFGMFWMTGNTLIDLIMPVAYLIANYVFFWRVFGRAVCATCAYHHPDLSREEYRVRLEDPFIRALNRWYKVWLLIGWGWPVAVMLTIYLVWRAPVVLVSLLLFVVVSFGVFLPVLRLRVCPSCKVNELGICPFFASRSS